MSNSRRWREFIEWWRDFNGFPLTNETEILVKAINYKIEEIKRNEDKHGEK